MFSREEVSEQELPVEVERLASDLYALVLFLLKSGTPGLLQALGESDLSMTQIKLLHHLEHAERDLALKELAEMTGISLPAASRAVDELFHRRLVERNEDAQDRRMKRVHITEPGREVSMRLNACRLIGLQQFAANLDPSEREILDAALSRLLAREEIAACRPKEAHP